MFRSTAIVVLLLATGCVKGPPARPETPFVWVARSVEGDVRVLEAVATHAPPELQLGSYLGDSLPEARVAVRTERMHQLTALPASVGWELPGAMNRALGAGWPGAFHSARWPSGRRDRVAEALQRGHGLDEALGELAGAVGGDAVLVSWVDRLEGEPLSLRGFPGDLVTTPTGPVVIDHGDEPFLVDVRVGMALVAHDGEVVVRYHQDMHTVVSEARPPDVAARQLASDLVEEVVKVWHRPDATARTGRHVAP